ncbi:MAG: hypothetical protein A3B38_02540 [Candidatus Levybacteria bacterium RIFCSPLOWO2_01_FULL_36_13]|nr:MAG: hypothetical protein A2684_03735 [Candidatus Levybacteria bacterium RIFCSPHIGHO2_01_FULL_36_15b]OGH35159.1 MAG: hypothetical protein A3B38_02540 [Candidatus Levybacteria bacterium RIFCSPLOWO2_01_FULL_36_13]
MKLGKKEFLNFSFLFTTVFIIFTVLVNFNLLTKFDFDTTLILQKFIPQSIDTLFSAFSLIGNAEIAGLFLLLILLIFKKLNIIIVLLLFVLLHIPELFLKSNLSHSGPPIEFLRTIKLFPIPQISIPGEYFSYPSGHSARTVFISIILFVLISRLKLSRNTKYLVYGAILTFDFTMLVSRVYLGEHWTSDVIGGSLLGAAFAFIGILLI